MDVLGTLRDEEHANTLRPNQPYDLLDLIEQPLARIVEDQMRLVEEEHELWLVNVANLRELVVQSSQHPQHERAEQVRLVLYVLQLENAYQSPPVTLNLHQVLQVELRLAEELLGSLLLQLHHLAKQDANGLFGHSTVILELSSTVRGEIDRKSVV